MAAVTMTLEEQWRRAVLAHQSGDFAVAEAAYQNVISQHLHHAGALYMLGELQLTKGETALALSNWRMAWKANPSWPEPGLAISRELIRAEQFAQAESVLLSLASLHNQEIRLHRLAAKLMLATGRIPQAFVALRTVTEMSSATTVDWQEFADFERKIGQIEPALRHYAKALELDPQNQIAAINAGALCQVCGRNEEAIRWYRHAHSIDPDGEFVIQFADALLAAGQYAIRSELISALSVERAASLDGQRLKLEDAQYRGNFAEVEAAIHSCYVNTNTSERNALEAFGLVRLYFPASDAQHSHYYRAVQNSFATSIANATSHLGLQIGNEAPNSVGRPLRVGYIGADFREHVMGRMTLSILENRDRESQSVHVYALNTAEDAITQRFLRAADSYVRCAGVNDETVAQKIFDDKLDILVDLSGPTAGARAGILAHKPAPVLISHVGAAGPIGLAAIDYKLTDAVCDQSENQAYHIETLLKMDGCCYPVPKYPLPTAGLNKNALGLNGRIVIAAFFTHLKLSHQCLKLWKRIVDELPEAVIIFSPLNVSIEHAYKNLMMSVGIDAQQYRFIGAGPTEAERLARYRVVDFVLDSMPYGGVNGTLEALYMGVPVVTLTGKHHSERTTTSMLTHLGVTDTIAASPEEYIAHAKRLASDSAWKEDIVSRIRARWPKFSDPVDYARRWEALLRKVAK